MKFEEKVEHRILKGYSQEIAFYHMASLETDSLNQKQGKKRSLMNLRGCWKMVRRLLEHG